MKKLTVSSIKVINSFSKNSEKISNQSGCSYINIYEDFIITHQEQNNNLLTIKTLNKRDIIFQQQISITKIKSTALLGNLLGIVCWHKKQFYVVNLKNGTLTTCQGHMDAINEVLIFEGCFLTAGKDLTIRIWEISNKKQQQIIKFPKALKGHKMQINTLATFHQFFFSGSDDKNLIVWHNNQIWCQYLFTESIIKIQPFPLSSQLIVITKDFLAYFINIDTIIKKNIKIRGTINLTQLSQPIQLIQMDDSFGVVLEKDKLKFIQINLIKNMHQIFIQDVSYEGQSNKSLYPDKNNNKIISMKYSGRCLFYCVSDLGVQVIKI